MAISYSITQHAVAFPSKVKSSECGHIYNIKLNADYDNGNFVGKGTWAGLDCYNATAATEFEGIVRGTSAAGNYWVEVTKPGDALFVHMPVVISQEWTNDWKKESNWYNKSGEIVRGYELSIGDILEISAAGFTETPVLVAGTDYVVELSGKKLAHQTTAPVEGAVAAVVDAAPTTTTVGKLGEMRVNGTKLYVCTAIEDSTYTWKSVTLA